METRGRAFKFRLISETAGQRASPIERQVSHVTQMDRWPSGYRARQLPKMSRFDSRASHIYVLSCSCNTIECYNLTIGLIRKLK